MSGARRYARRAVVGVGVGGVLLYALTGQAPAVLLGCVLGAAVAVLLARRADTRQAAERSRAVRAQLPDILDLLAAVVDGGAAPGHALGRVCARLPGDLAAELVRIGDTADDGVVARIAAIDPALRPLAALLRQSEELGVPVAGALRLLAVDARARLRADLRECAGAAAPRMLLVVGGLLAPAALLVVIGGQVLALREIVGGVAG